MAALQSTEATPGKRDATGPLAGVTRDALLVGALTWVLINVTGFSDLCAGEISAKMAALVMGGGVGLLTGLRKFLANLATPS